MRSTGQELFTFEGYTLDLTRGCVLVGTNGEIELRPKSFELLRYLVENAGRLIPKDELVNAVWPNVIVSDDSLAQCVSELRQALNDPDRRIIKTTPRRGYLFAAPVSVSPASTRSPPMEVGATVPISPSSDTHPVENIGGDPDQNHFSLGVAEAGPKVRRNLAAILIADVAGYTRLMDIWEAETHTRLMALLSNVVESAIAAQNGWIVKKAGDGFLACFDSVNSAVQSAIRIQQEVQRREATQPAEQRITYRMGIHLGDVMLSAGDVYGAGVNVAARLQELAEPGSLMISAAVRDQLGTRLLVPTVDLGNLYLRNIANPVRAFRVVVSPEQGRSRSGAVASRGQPSVVVLPFRTLDPAPEKAYFGECIVEDIIAGLATLEELRVISRSSTLRYQGTDKDLRQVGLDFGARYVLTGSVQPSRQRNRITAELADTETGLVLWAQSYDAEVEELFEVQDRITAQIVGTITPCVRAAEVRRAFQKRPENMDAYDHVLQARQLLWRPEPTEFARAGTLLRRAIALDDSYSIPCALAAQWHSIRIAYGWSPNIEADEQECMRMAQAAVDRDVFSASALAVLGHINLTVLDYDAALALFERALNTSPSSAWAWGFSAPTYSYIGDGTAAIARAERALSLSPMDPLAFWYHTIAVGTAITGRPPHRSGLARLRHPAPTSGV